MRIVTFVIIGLSLVIGIIYYFSYGRYNSTHVQQVKILYAPTAVPPPPTRPIIFTNDNSQNQKDKSSPAGTCVTLPQKLDVIKAYKTSSGKDCGSIEGNEMVLNEENTQKVKKCLTDGLIKGACDERKAYVSLRGFEGVMEEFIFISECNVQITQWAPYTPSCGTVSQSCTQISQRFPFIVCEN